MDANEIMTFLGTLLGVLTPLGGVGIFFYRKQTRRLKDAEAALAEVSVDKAKVEGQADQWHIFKEQYESVAEMNQKLIERNTELINKNREKETYFENQLNDKTGRIREKDDMIADLNKKLLNNERYISSLKSYIQWLKDWLCEREHGEGKEDCLRRKPRPKVNLPYNPPAEIKNEILEVRG